MIALVLGACAAWAIAGSGRGTSPRWASWTDTALMVPLGTSAVTIGFGFFVAFDRSPVDLRSSVWLIPLAHAVVAMPFVVRLLVPALRSIDPELREAAGVLGASPLRVWREIDLPVVSRALAAAAGFAFAVSLGEFGATVFLARPERPDGARRHLPGARPPGRDQLRPGHGPVGRPDGAHGRGRAGDRPAPPGRVGGVLT